MKSTAAPDTYRSGVARVSSQVKLRSSQSRPGGKCFAFVLEAVESHRIASHRIALHRIASHCIALHRTEHKHTCDDRHDEVAALDDERCVRRERGGRERQLGCFGLLPARPSMPSTEIPQPLRHAGLDTTGSETQALAHATWRAVLRV